MEGNSHADGGNEPHADVQNDTSFATSERLDFESLYQEFNRLRPRSSLGRPSTSMSPRRSSKTKVDLRELEYVSDYDPHLMCPICHVPFIDPISLKCDHIFCYSCFVEYREQPNNTTCPSCRASLDPYYHEWKSVPRLIINMCDDIKVRCPYQAEGCAEVLARGYVSHHADSQCEYRPVPCSDPTCSQTLPCKYAEKEGCRHGLIECPGCASEIHEWAMDRHITSTCQNPPTRCEECSAVETKGETMIHRDTCSKSFVDCSAKQYGCSHRTSSSLLNDHERRCIFKGFEPYLQSQADKINLLEKELTREKARSESLEGGIDRLWEILTRQLAPVVETLSKSQRPDSDFHPLATIDTGGTATAATAVSSDWDQSRANGDGRLPSLAVVTQGQSSTTATESTRHLLSLHEGLRSQVDGVISQMSNIDASLATIEARQSMALMNETLRIKEELAHLTAGLFTMRSQMNWLLNHRNTQLRGRDGVPAPASLLGADGSRQTTAGSPLPGPSSSSTATLTAPPPPRRASSGHSSQERVKL